MNTMKTRILSGVALAAIMCGAALFSGLPSAGATEAMTVTVGSPVQITDRLMVTVPVQVVCAPIGNPGDITTSDTVTVSLSQANGRSVSHGTATVSAGPSSPYNPNSPGFLTCDGATVNPVTLQVLGSGPFHGGGAIISVTAAHSVGTCIFPGYCPADASESASVGPMGVNLQGGSK
jgi:hypothetical protein